MQETCSSATLIRAAQEAARQRIREDQRGAPPDVAAILDSLEEGPFDPAFSIAAARRASGATQTADQRFQQRLGTTMQKYVRQRKLEAAKEMVDDLRIDLGAVPRALGFGDDANRFCRWFKKWANKTPTQRRAEILEWPDFETWARMAVGGVRLEEAEELLCRAESAVQPPPPKGPRRST